MVGLKADTVNSCAKRDQGRTRKKKDLSKLAAPGIESTTSVRRRNTRYKKPQLVAQHCFVACFWSMSPVAFKKDISGATRAHSGVDI